MGEAHPDDSRSGQPQELSKSDIQLVRLDALGRNFESNFGRHREGFFRVLSHSYAVYYGDDYHMQRIVGGRSIVYYMLANNEVVAASYVKRNCRRGGTAVYPEAYRRLGLAQALVTASLADFPEQYSILGLLQTNMTQLLLRLGFVRAVSIEQIKSLTGEDFKFLSDFTMLDGSVVFKRYSVKRTADRETLILLYRSERANT